MCIRIKLFTHTHTHTYIYIYIYNTSLECLTQLYGGKDMYNLLHKQQLYVLALFIDHLQVDK